MRSVREAIRVEKGELEYRRRRLEFECRVCRRRAAVDCVGDADRVLIVVQLGAKDGDGGPCEEKSSSTVSGEESEDGTPTHR